MNESEGYMSAEVKNISRQHEIEEFYEAYGMIDEHLES